MTDQLTVYNLALTLLGERKLAALNEAREPRRVLDALWPTVTAYCLAQGVWQFAMRVSASLTQGGGGFGYQHGYPLPSDVIYVVLLSDQVALFPQLDRDFMRLPGAVYTSSNALYCVYTSNDATSGGMNLTGWSGGFTAYVAASLARFACARIAGSLELIDMLREREDEAYVSSFSVDSVSMPLGILPLNAATRAPRADENLQIDSSLMPFAAYRRAVARLEQRASGGQRSAERGG